MLGGGTFTVQNKRLPGAYINFISAGRASAALSERGIAAVAAEMDWGPEKTMVTVEAAEFEKEARSLFGYAYYEEPVKGIRELFKGARTALLYRLNGGEKASNTYGTARYGGIRGNDLIIIIQANEEDGEKFDVITMLGEARIDRQTVSSPAELIDNEFVVFHKDAGLTETAGLAMTGGTNGSKADAEAYQGFLDRLENCSFHTLGCLSGDSGVKGMFAAFTRRMRDEMGMKFQTVLHDWAADYEGIINVKNTVKETGAAGPELVWWVTGAQAGCAVNRTLTNVRYDGEYTVDTRLKQSELEQLTGQGYFVLHSVGTETRVLSDINSLVSFSDEKTSDFSENQVVRTLDQIGNDIAVTFCARYLGKAQNNEAGRTGLWNDIAVYCRELERIGALENFSGADVSVAEGTDKKSVTVSCMVTPVCAMSKLYMTVTVR